METLEDTTVLLVDDEPQLLDVYELWLGGDCDVLTAEGGEEALETADESVDVAFLDRRMPGFSGDEVLREFRARGYDFQVAMLTAVDPEEEIVDMPFDDYLTKPIEEHELRSVIGTLLKRDQYDEQGQQLFALASKRAALEASPDVDHTDSEEYERLSARIDDLREEIDTTIEDVVDRDPSAAFEMI